jgi:hypothetical protein
MSENREDIFRAISAKQDEAVNKVTEYVEATFPQVWHWHIWQAIRNHAELRERKEFPKHFSDDGEYADREHSDYEAHIHREQRKLNPDMERDDYFLMPKNDSRLKATSK